MQTLIPTQHGPLNLGGWRKTPSRDMTGFSQKEAGASTRPGILSGGMRHDRDSLGCNPNYSS